MADKKTFFVTGLPRSRTAWCANWLTTDRSFCWHDRTFDPEPACVGLRRGEQEHEQEQEHERKYVGWSGSELVTQFDEIFKVHPEAPWLIVERKPFDVLESLMAVNARDTREGAAVSYDQVERYIQERRRLLECLKGRGRTLVVSAVLLDWEITAEAVWEHLLPGLPFDVERWRLLKGLNVQQDLDKAADSLKAGLPTLQTVHACE